MTKDYEADRIADETRRDVEHRMRSPYTRAEFVARELATRGSTDADRAEWNAQAAERAGITWRNEAASAPDKDAIRRDITGGMLSALSDTNAAGIVRAADKPLVDWLAELSARLTAAETRIGQLDNSQLAEVDYEERLNEWRGQMAERVTNLERLSSALKDRVLGSNEIDDNDEYTPVLDRLDGLANRMSTANARITATEKAVRALEQQVARPTVAEIRDPTGARTAYHAIDERAKAEIRALIREGTGSLADQIHQRVEEVIQPACETISDHDRRLSLQLERITELTNRVEHVDRRLAEVDCQLASQLSVQVTWNRDIEAQVRRLDARVNWTPIDLRGRVEEIWARLFINVHAPVEAPDAIGLIEQVRGLADKLNETQDAVEDARDIARSAWNSLHGKAFRDEDGCPGLLDVVRRLDADMALVRDAVCPPQGTAVRVDNSAHPVDVLADSVKVRSPIFDPVHGVARVTAPAVDWPDPTTAMLESPVFEAIWQTIKAWDIAVPGAYSGYTGATGNHVRAILDAIRGWSMQADRLDKHAEHLRQTRDALRAACLELGADATWSDDTNLADVVSKVLMPRLTDSRAPFTFGDWWTHFTRDGIYLGNGINVDRESTIVNVLYRYLRQTWNAAQGRASIQAGADGAAQQDDDDP